MLQWQCWVFATEIVNIFWLVLYRKLLLTPSFGLLGPNSNMGGCDTPPPKKKQSLDTSKVFKNSAQFWHCLLGESMRFHRSYSTDPSPSSDTSPKPQAVMCASDWLEVPTLTSLSSVNSLRGSQNSGRHLLTFTTLLKGKAKYGPIAVWRDTQNEVLTRGVSVLVESGAWLSGTWSVLVSQLWKLSQKDQKDILLGFIWRVHYVVMIS